MKPASIASCFNLHGFFGSASHGLRAIDELLNHCHEMTGRARAACVDQRLAANDFAKELEAHDQGEDHCGSLTCVGTRQ